MTSFRMRGETVLDFPLHTTLKAGTWVATMWPDARAPRGWARDAWAVGPHGRGFIPTVLDLADVIQFGVQHSPDVTRHWYGYLHAIRPNSLLIHGPHPDPDQALAAAQTALVEQIHTPTSPTIDSRRSSLGIELPGADPSTVPTSLAQPPATVSVAFHGQQATIGDPRHGWLVVDTASLVAAMPYPPERLTAVLREHVPNLDGNEAPVTLAALVAHILPNGVPPQPQPPVTHARNDPDIASPDAATPGATPKTPDGPTTSASPQPSEPGPGDPQGSEQPQPDPAPAADPAGPDTPNPPAPAPQPPGTPPNKPTTPEPRPASPVPTSPPQTIPTSDVDPGVAPRPLPDSHIPDGSL